VERAARLVLVAVSTAVLAESVAPPRVAASQALLALPGKVEMARAVVRVATVAWVVAVQREA